MATKKVRQRISYVLEDARSVGHRLGVNGLAVDSENNILYSGGRDGVVCAWDLRLDEPKKAAAHKDDKDDGDNETAPLGSQKAPTTNGTKESKPAVRPQAQTATSRAQTQAHTHWINDIALAQNNTALVTASSDLLVKVWRPRLDDNDDEPAILGKHADYVKCVASPGRQATWVASGGLDRRICLWDLNGGGKTLEIDVSGEEHAEKGSVYALRANHSILASGGPESTVRLWDPRTGGKNITKFVGHTDNVRAILVNEAGDTVMTASADQTVKVWSVTAGRCMHTLTMHSDSVWSLYSESPDLSVFYSSDRSGLVVKTDVRGSGDSGGGFLDDIDNGLSVAVAQEHDGVSKVVASNGFIWTATSSSSINRWADVDTATAAAAGEVDPMATTPQASQNPPRPFSPADTVRPHSSSVSSTRTSTSPPTVGAAGAAATNGVAAPAPRAIPADIPAKSILRISNTAVFPAHLLPDASTLSGNSAAQAAAAPGSNPAAAGSGADGKTTAADVDDADLLDVVEPVHRLPVETIEGTYGLVKHRLLNDRRRVLTLDTAGEVLLWDIINCKQLRKFGKRHLEDVEPEVNTTEAVAPWCSIDVSSGNLTVVLEQYNCFDAEMYADELVLDEPIEFREDQRINLGKWIMRYLFANLIDEEIRRDEIYRAKLNETVEKKIQAAAAASNSSMPDVGSGAPGMIALPTGPFVPPTPGIGLATPLPAGTTAQTPMSPLDGRTAAPTGRQSVEKEDYFSNAITSVEQATTPGLTRLATTPAATTSATAEQQQQTPDAAKEKETTVKTPGTPFGKKFRMSFGTKKLGRSASTSVPDKPSGSAVGADEKGGAAANGAGGSGGDGENNSESASSQQEKGGGSGGAANIAEATIDDCFVGVVQRLRHEYDRQAADPHPDKLVASRLAPCPPDEAPLLQLPPKTKIIIQEELKGGSIELYRGTVGDVGRPRDVDKIERCAPLWLAEALLLNNAAPKESNKISFLLLPYKDALPSLSSPDGSSRLNANRMLRVKKILAYVAEKIDPPPAPAQAPATGGPLPTTEEEPTDAEEPAEEGGAAEEGGEGGAAAAAAAVPEDPFADPPDAEPAEEPLKPEEYLELYCNEQRLPNAMSLATVRAHIWKNSNDILLYYRANGRKELHFDPDSLLGQGQVGSGTAATTGEAPAAPAAAAAASQPAAAPTATAAA